MARKPSVDWSVFSALADRSESLQAAVAALDRLIAKAPDGRVTFAFTGFFKEKYADGRIASAVEKGGARTAMVALHAIRELAVSEAYSPQELDELAKTMASVRRVLRACLPIAPPEQSPSAKSNPDQPCAPDSYGRKLPK